MKELKISNGLTIAYQKIQGDKKKPTILFLHEGLGCIAAWKQFPEQLCERLGCPGLVYDRQGYGNSSPLNKAMTVHFMHDYALQELPEVVHRLLTGRPFIIVGHSDGGSIGLIYAAEKDPNLLGVITEAAHVFVDHQTIMGIRATRNAYGTGKIEVLKKYHGDKSDDTFIAWADIWLSDGFRHWNLEYLLPSITCPVLAIQGKRDQYGIESQIDAIVSMVSGHCEKTMIDDCGHAPHNEHRELLLNRMVAFIDGLILKSTNNSSTKY